MASGLVMPTTKQMINDHYLGHVERFFPKFRDPQRENYLLNNFIGKQLTEELRKYHDECMAKEEMRTQEMFDRMQRERESALPQSYWDLDKELDLAIEFDDLDN